MNDGPLAHLVGHALTGWTADARGLTLHFGSRRFVLAIGEGLLVEIDEEEDRS